MSMKVIPSKTNSLILVRSVIVLTVLIATATLLWSLQPAHAAGTLTVNSLAETNDATYDAAECALDEARNAPNNNPGADQRQTAPSLFQTPPGRQVEKQYQPEELEQLRSMLLEFVDTVKEYSDLLLPDNPELGRKLDAARKQFEQYSPQQLYTLRATLNPAEMNARFGEARAALEQYRPALESIRQEKQRSKLQQSSGMVQIESAGLPDRAGPDAVCNAIPGVGTGRVSFAVTTAADAIFLTAAGIRAGLSRGCNQVLVVAGEGGNTSSACIAADVVYYAALAVRAKLTACDLDYTGRTVDANFSRLGHIHTDLENSVANDNTNKTAIVNNDNTNTTTILTAIANSQTAINNNTNAGKNELRDLILRTQIEANLADEGGNHFIGLYIMPSANGGYLELVRSIVVDTIAKLAGKHTADANKWLAQGDAQKAAGNFKEAYEAYRKAYLAAVGK